jgi:REP element-mobilizing transposase RayT
MARQLRLEFPGALYHITSRGNNKQEVFLDDEDRRDFLDLTGKEIEQQKWKCYAYCIMDNHYHLVIETPEGNLVSGMRRLNAVYSQIFNRKHGRVGHLFQGRYKSLIVEREGYLLELCRYVVLNPVRAGIVDQPEQWEWSSFNDTVGLRAEPRWLDTKGVLELFSHDETEAHAQYRLFVLDGIGGPSPWEKIKGQIWLGSKEFLEDMDGRINKESINNVPITQTVPTRPTKIEVLNSVGSEYCVELDEIMDRRDARAYKAAVYLLRRVANLELKAVAEEFGISTTRVSKIQGEIERMDKIDLKLLKLLRKYKVKQ